MESTSLSNSLCLKMKTVISEINNYLNTRNEFSVLSINKSLQTLSVTSDFNIFDPETNTGANFFMALYRLFNKIEAHSQMAWYCVDVLANACCNTSARKALINTYNFIPCLVRLLDDQLSSVKKKKLLKLMQDLSCGIKICWQIPHLPHLLKTLTKWVEGRDDDIVCLSLGVLVNLCHKNMPVVYCLSKNVDIKKFLRFCLPLRGPIIETHVCRLMMFLDYMQTDIPQDIIGNIVTQTFASMYEAYKNNDFIHLRQILDIFQEAINHSENMHVFRQFKQYGEQVQRLLQLVENNVSKNSSDQESLSKDGPKCIAMLLEFFRSLLHHDVDSLTPMHAKISNLAIDWVNCEWVSYQALLVLTKIAEKTIENDATNNLLLTALPSFALILQSNVVPTNMESCRRLGASLLLFRAMLQKTHFRANILQTLTIDDMQKMFDNLQVDCLPYLKSGDANMTTTDAVHSYLYGLNLISELAQYNASWLDLQKSLMENRKIHMIISHAFYGGTTEIRGLALEICRHPSLPIKEIASTMGVLQPIFASTSQDSTKTLRVTQDIVDVPTISFTQIEELDDILHQMQISIVDSSFSQILINEHNVGDLASRQVMEMYEYKLTTLVDAENAAQSSIEAATERCTQLQHRLMQVTTIQNKLHQLLFYTDQCLDQTRKSKAEVQAMYVSEQNEKLAAQGQNKVLDGQLKSKERALADCMEQLEDCHRKIQDLSEIMKNMENRLTKKELFVDKLLETSNKLEKHLQKTEEQLKKSNEDNKKLNLQIANLEEKLNLKEMEVAEMKEQLEAKRKIIQTIAKVATSPLPPP